MSNNFTLGKRTQRVQIAIPVSLFEGTEREDTTTLVVNARGALVALRMQTAVGQRLSLVHKASGTRIECSVVSRQETKDGQIHVGIAFDEPAPRYWGLSFPPEDWNSADRKLHAPTLTGPVKS